MSPHIRNISDYSDRLVFTLLSGGGRFPKVGPFGDDHQSNLAVAFQVLFDGLPVVNAHLKDDTKVARVREMLESSREAYRNGDNVAGGRLLDEISDIVSPNRYSEYARRKGLPDNA